MAEKRLKEEEKKAAAEAAAKLAAEAAEREKHEAFVKAREEKRMQLANSHADQVRQRREEELQIQLQRNQLRAEENARKRLAREEKEKAVSWPYKMRLHAAALEGNREVAEVFLQEDEEGAFNVARIDPNVINREDGQSPIYLAVVRGQLDMIGRLIAAKADVNFRNNDGRAPLSLGAEFGQTAAMTILIEAGANINAVDARGRTALHVAVAFNRVDTARQLLAWNADPNIQSKTQKWTPLHLAAMSASPNMLMVWLLLAGPDLPIKALAKQIGGLENSFDDNDALEDEAATEAEEEEEVEVEEEAWSSDSDELVEEDSYEKIEGDVPRLLPGAVWDEYVRHNMAETTLQGLALLRLKNIYPKAWMYNDDDELFEMVMKRCPGLPLPPYISSLSLCTAMDETPMDTAPPGSAIYKALEAACLLDNERNERLTEDEEKASGILRPTLTGEKQMARRRTRKQALVIGNGKGPGGLDTPVCRADAESVARHFRDLGLEVTLSLDASLDQMLEAIDGIKSGMQEGDLVVFYFSGHARSAHGTNYLVPSGGPVDNLDTADKFETRAVKLREHVIKPLQAAIGTLTMIILDCFRASVSIPAPAGCGLWRQGKGDWTKRIPARFIPHIRPPGLASSNLIYPTAEASGDAAVEHSFESIDAEQSGSMHRGLERTDSGLSSLLSSVVMHGDAEAPPAYMEGNMQGVPKNTWAVLAGDSIVEEVDLEEDLADEASLCLVYSNHPGGELFANEAMLKSPFTDKFTMHVYNPGGGANLAGGNYPMMFADIKSSVMQATNGRQLPWTCIVPDDADKVFCFVPPPIPPGSKAQSRATTAAPASGVE
eukprot:Tamp_05875.p1 GENE.Tamp_05875~~Tamp_05875.p1  ORF type:complete len:918 (+),score=233.53 Tamp_05875:260-2755(+)